MTKSFYYIGLLTILSILSNNVCYANDDPGKVRQKILRIARKISHYKTVDFGFVGFSPTITKQYDRFLILLKDGTDAEIVLLTDHRSPKVRVYAFNILVGRKHKDLKTILEKHIGDKEIFTIRSGCFRSKDRVNLYFLSRMTPRSKEGKNLLLSQEEIEYYKNKINEANRRYNK